MRDTDSEVIALEGAGRGEALAVKVRRNARARKLRLRIDRLSGIPVLSVPVGTPRRVARQFVVENRAWLTRELARLGARIRLEPDARFPLRGELVSIAHAPENGRQVRELADRLCVGGPVEFVENRIMRWLKDRANDELALMSHRHASRLGLSLAYVGVREMRSRWGSASANRRLRFSWRLIFAPPHVADYVAAHEVAHLVELNHSPAFWAVVEDLYGDHRKARRWLRRNGPDLLRIGPPPAH